MTLDLQHEQAKAELSELANHWAELRNVHGSRRAELAATHGTEAHRVFHALEKARIRFGKLAARRAEKRLAECN